MTYGAKQLIGKIGSVIGAFGVVVLFLWFVSQHDDKAEKQPTNYVKLGEFPEIHKPKR